MSRIQYQTAGVTPCQPDFFSSYPTAKVRPPSTGLSRRYSSKDIRRARPFAPTGSHTRVSFSNGSLQRPKGNGRLFGERPVSILQQIGQGCVTAVSSFTSKPAVLELIIMFKQSYTFRQMYTGGWNSLESE